MHQNKLFLAGEVLTHPIFWPDDPRLRVFLLRVPRLSGVDDILPIRTPLNTRLKTGEYITLHGSVRTESYYSPNQRHLLTYGFAEKIDLSTEASIMKLKVRNSVKATGILCRNDDYRETPAGKIVCDLILECHRGKFIDHLHGIAWGKNAKHAASLSKGQRLAISGRFQSREYMKQTEDGVKPKTAFEISIRQFHPVTDPAEI